MSKKISAFWNNFKIYIVITITLLIVLFGALLVVRNITKDKSDQVETTSVDGDDSPSVELVEENSPIEPIAPTLELPKIQPSEEN